LRFRDRLEHLALTAKDAQREGDSTGALVALREMLELLPVESRQHETIRERVTELSRELDLPGSAGRAGASEPKPRRPWAQLGVLGALALLAFKFKWVLMFLASKGKLLLLGLSKAGTAWSMIASLGLYWAVFGWWFALGLVVSIYIHEMGHVAALTRLGIRASAPMFIPGLGALVRLEQYPEEPREDARIGLAGPRWGLGAAVAASGVYLATAAPIWAAIAAFGAWINLFNLLPLGPLDGGRGFRALSQGQRFLSTGVLIGGAVLSGDGLLWLLVAVAAFRAWSGPAPAEGDPRAAWEYNLQIVAFCALLRWLPALNAGA
jgi:Zn-dependent protease